VSAVPKRKARLVLGVGATGQDLLDHWGATLYEAFGEVAYHVGSSAMKKTGWRDVDVRMIMEDDKFEQLFGKYHAGRCHAFWVAMMLSFSLWGQKVTGLPIDFQIVKRSDVTKADWEKPRNPLGIFPSNVERPPWQRWEQASE
jgi:hypothetical protein